MLHCCGSSSLGVPIMAGPDRTGTVSSFHLSFHLSPSGRIRIALVRLRNSKRFFFVFFLFTVRDLVAIFAASHGLVSTFFQCSISVVGTCWVSTAYFTPTIQRK